MNHPVKKLVKRFVIGGLILITFIGITQKGEVSGNIGFNKEALLVKIQDSSRLYDIRWVENKGQLGSEISQDKAFCEKVQYYAKTDWGYMLVLKDNSLVLNFIKPILYEKPISEKCLKEGDKNPDQESQNVKVIVEQPDWEDEIIEAYPNLSKKELIRLKKKGYLNYRGDELYLYSTYRGQIKKRVKQKKRKREKKRAERAGRSLEDNDPYGPGERDPLAGFKLKTRTYQVSLNINGKKPIRIETEGKRVEKQSYFIGNDPSKWSSSLPTHNELWAYFEGGIAFRFYGKGDKMKREILVPEGLSLSDIHITYESQQEFILSTREGELELAFAGYKFKEEKPLSYCMMEGGGGERKEVVARFKVEKGLEKKGEGKEVVAGGKNVWRRSFQIEAEWDGKGQFVF
ncbi:MAG: hypothetical protein V1872_10270 [bacterium]